MADGVDNSKVLGANGTEIHTTPGQPTAGDDSPPLIKAKPSRDSYWFAHGGPEAVPAGNARHVLKPPDAKDAQSQKEREEKIKQFREQQEGERLRRMKEMEQSFVLSRMYREQQEEERRRRIDEAKSKEIERRQQVEERKRQIWEAEQERKEAILRRNMERESRIEARRNAQRNSFCFAFGSSTPRTFDLDLAAIGRNSSVGSPLMSAVSSRRSEERDVGPKRATSACSLDRKPDSYDIPDVSCNAIATTVERDTNEVNIAKPVVIDYMNSERTKACLTMDDSFSLGAGSLSSYTNCPSSRWLVGSGALVGDDCMSWSMISLSSATRGRRRTDLLPVTPRERSTTPHTRPRGKDTSRSPSRPQSSMSGRSELSVSSSQASSVSLRPKPAPRKPRPVSIAGTTVDRSVWNSGSVSDRKPRLYERSVSPNKPMKSTEQENAVKNSSNKKPVPPPKSAQVLAKVRNHQVPTKDNLRKPIKVAAEPKPNSEPVTAIAVVNGSSSEPQEVTSPTSDEIPPPSVTTDIAQGESKTALPVKNQSIDATVTAIENQQDIDPRSASSNKVQNELIISAEHPTSREGSVCSDSVPAKQRITSEEEARTALAEKRRLAREQAEREAELERQRNEELRRQDEEQKRLEELEQKRMEEEQLQLAQLHRKLEEEKLKKAIEEQRQREEEERERREEEARLKAEKDEQEKKAREEAEKQRLELEDRLRKEELERAERKKRVEQIMSRTRGRGTQSVTAASNNKDSQPPVENNTQTVLNSSSVIINNSSPANDVNSVTVIGTAVTNTISKSSMQSYEAQTVQPCNVDDLVHHVNVKNGFLEESSGQLSVMPSVVNSVPNRTSNEDSAYNLQTNGYSSHEDSSMMSSPEERSDKSDGLLLDFQTSQTVANNITNGKTTELNHQLIDINVDAKTAHPHNDNFMIDVVNSNIVSSNNPFLTFEDNLPKKQENAFPDLLS